MNAILHPLSDADRAAMAQIRQMAAPAKGVLERTAFDGVMEHTAPAATVAYEAGSVGGVAGWWVRPAGAPKTSAILYLHGGGYVVGSAKAYRNFVGQIARAAGVSAFVSDYRLAPEHPFPAAMEDAMAAYQGLAELGFSEVALAGDSAGGGLALILLALTAAAARDGRGRPPVAAAVMSPWADLALTGTTLASKAEADPFLTPAALQSAAAQYLGPHDPRGSMASPLYGDLAGLAPVLIHVGEDEILLDDARRYAERLAAAGGDVELHQWAGMPHVFPANVGVLSTAQPAVDAIGQFLCAACAASTSTEKIR
jgi:epsilon-lactone hydrolase